MDPGLRPSLIPVWITMIGLLGTAAGLHCGVTECLGSDIALIPLTNTPPSKCFSNRNESRENSRYRYECIDGYLRKVGTSSLIICKEGASGGPPVWVPNPPNLVCTPDPRIKTKTPSTTDPNKTTTLPPNSTVTNGLSDFTRHSPNAFTSTVTPPAETSSRVLMKINSSVTAGPSVTETTSPGLIDLEEPPVKNNQTTLLNKTGVNHKVSLHKYGIKEDKDDVTSRWPTSAPTPADQRGSAQTWPHAVPAAIGCLVVVIICSLIGISVFCYKRRSKPDVQLGSPEEQLPMNKVPPEH